MTTKGKGGKSMEDLIQTKGLISGVLDITTTEWADELVGGVLNAGPHRLEGAAKGAIPAVIVPGCLDMVNFWEEDSVPTQFKDSGRLFYKHNSSMTLMRTNIDENRELGRIIAVKLNDSKAPTSVLIPGKGFSLLGSSNGQFWDPEADAAFIDEFKKNLSSSLVKVIEMKECNVNDTEFAQRCAQELLNNINARSKSLK